MPGDVVTTPGRLPEVCAKHGRPASRRVKLALQSRTRISGSRALSGNVLSVGNRLGQWAQQVRITYVRDWPLCRRCALRRTTLLTTSVIMFWGGIVLLVGGFVARLVIGHASPALGMPVMLGFGLPLGAVVPFAIGSLPRLTRARTSSDGESVLVESPHAAFAARIAAHDDSQ